MEKIGELLKNKREEKTLSLDTVSEETGINLDYLNALENSDFASFKNKVYARSFLRDYANYLCLDTHKILDDFEEEFLKINETKELEEICDCGEELPDSKSFLGKPLGIFIVFLLLCLIAFYIGKMSNNEPKKTLPKESVVAPAKNVEPIKEAPKAPIKEAPKTQEQSDVHSVVVYAHKNLWVKIKIDGKAAYEGKIGAGQNLSYKVKKSIQLRGGEPSGCQINVDGKSIGKLGNPGKPFNLSLTMGNNVVITQ